MSVDFITSVSDAVAQSVNKLKPMLVFVSSENDVSKKWSHQFFTDEQVVTTITDNLVGLKLVKPSEQYEYFNQIFPDPKTPSIYFIKSGQLLDVIDLEITVDEFKARLDVVVQGAKEETNGAAPSREHETTLSGATSTFQPPNTIAPSKPPLSNTPKHSGASQAKKKDTLRSQIVADKADSYKKELLRKQKQSRQEKERIQSLVKADKLERERANKQKKPIKETHTEPSAGVARTIPLITVLSIRLLDGSRITHEFKSCENLLKVREWVDANRSDGSDQPYIFYEAVTKRSYGVSEESLALSDLKLSPRSALILKPEDKYTSAYGGGSTGWFSKVSDAFYNVIGYEETKKQATSEEPEANTGTNSPSNRSGNVSSDDLNSFYSSSSHFNNSITSLSDLNRGRQGQDKKTIYNGNNTNLQDDKKLD